LAPTSEMCLRLHIRVAIGKKRKGITFLAAGWSGNTFRAQTIVTSNATQTPLGTVAEAIPGIIWIFDLDRRRASLSRLWSEYTGADCQPAGASDVLRFIHRDDIEPVKQGWERALETGQVFEVELRLRRRDGVYRWHRARAVPDRGAENRIARWVGVCLDVEEQRQIQVASAATQADLNRAKAELEETVAERTSELREVVEQLEAFAYTIAHDMRAPLRVMHQYAETVSRDFASQVPEAARVYLNKIMAASEKLDSLIREVLVYTRVSQGKLEMKPMNLERLLSEVLIMHPQLNQPHVELSARLPLHAVVGDATALTQAFSNLLTNAVKFVPSDRKPKVSVWTEQMGGQVRIYIKDNGVGIPLSAQDRIFRIFERLQPESGDEGSGIGLTIVRRAVQRMGGTVGVDSAEGQGSTFWIELARGDVS